MKLSDAYIVKDKKPSIEVTATMININFNHNMELLISCKPLYDYSFFINKIQTYKQEGYGFQKAVDMAVDYCIENHILEEILVEHRAEVKKMLLTEYSPQKHIKQERADANEQGQELFATLANKMIADGREDELQAACSDKSLRNKLYKEYKLK